MGKWIAIVIFGVGLGWSFTVAFGWEHERPTTTTIPIGFSTTTTLPECAAPVVCGVDRQELREVLYRFRVVGPCRTTKRGERCKRRYFKLIDP